MAGSPEVYKAVERAVYKGELIRSEKCEICNEICYTQGHHNDYTKPLDVVWLCASCHVFLHRRNGGVYDPTIQYSWN